jgi:hypothetical protein
MMQNVSATDPRGISLEAEIRFTQYRLDTACHIGSRSSALARMVGVRADASDPAGSRAAQLGRNAAIGTGLTAC